MIAPMPDSLSRRGPWLRLFDVAESMGGVEYYLIEQEGSRLSPMETAKACLENFRKLRAG